MEDVGWIKLYRSIRSSWIWDNGNERYAKWWIDILLMVNHKPNKVLVNGELIEIKTGERLTSTVKLSKEWGVSRNTVTKFLKLLERDEMISVSKSRKNGTTLKVLNYTNYQGFEEKKRQGSEQGSEHKQELKELKNNMSSENSEAEKVNYGALIKYLNEKTGRAFHNTEANRKLIKARLNDGFTKQDFKLVIDYKATDWKDNKDMQKYLRPNTLFAPSHFDDYLNEAKEYLNHANKLKTTSDGQQLGKSIKEIEAERAKHIKEIEERARRRLNEHRD